MRGKVRTSFNRNSTYYQVHATQRKPPPVCPSVEFALQQDWCPNAWNAVKRAFPNETRQDPCSLKLGELKGCNEVYRKRGKRRMLKRGTKGRNLDIGIPVCGRKARRNRMGNEGHQQKQIKSRLRSLVGACNLMEHYIAYIREAPHRSFCKLYHTPVCVRRGVYSTSVYWAAWTHRDTLAVTYSVPSCWPTRRLIYQYYPYIHKWVEVVEAAKPFGCLRAEFCNFSN